LLKIGTAKAICWNYLGLFRDYGLDHIFLGIKLFCFLKWKTTSLFGVSRGFMPPHLKTKTR
jgi:hypothetical protein